MPANNTDNNEIRARDIQFRTTALVLLFSIVSFLVLSFVTVNSLAKNEQTKTNLYYNALADKIGWQIDDWLKSESELVINNKHALEVNNDFSPEYLQSYLQMIFNDYTHGNISELFFLSSDNELYCGSGFVSSGDVDFRTRDWYVNAIGSDDIYYSTPYICDTGDLVVTLSTCVFDSEDNAVGVVGVDIPVDTMYEIIDSADIGQNSYLFIINKDQNFIVHPDPAYVTNDGFPVNVRQIPGDVYSPIENVLNGDLPDDQSGTVKNDYDGIYRKAYSGTVEISGWRVVIMIWARTIYLPIAKVLGTIILVLLFNIIIGLIIARTISRRLITRFSEAAVAAQAANEAKSSFLANMSHEIRTPINAVAGMNEMILRENKDPVINDYALDIASASRSLTSIINDILDFSKIESGKLEIVEGEFSVASVINDCINLAVSRLGDKDLELFFEADPDIPKMLIGDEMRIKQIMVNLMTNGIKYTREGFVTMSIGFSRHEYGINFNVKVRDSGIGIKPEDLDKLFSSFKRLDTKINQKVEGTGLGLSISKRLVGIMGGFINVSSEYGKGTEFRFSIPLKVAEDTPFVPKDRFKDVNALFMMNGFSTNSRAAEECIRVTNATARKLGIKYKIVSEPDMFKSEYESDKYTHIFTDLRSFELNKKDMTKISSSIPVAVIRSRYEEGEISDKTLNIHKPLHILNISNVFGVDMKAINTMVDDSVHGGFIAPQAKVLIVDDNLMNLKVAVGLMKKYEMNLITADGGQKAVDMVKASPDFDVIFMDHMMPEVDGIEATKRIRESDGEYFKNVPIIALTANTVNEAREMFLSSGFNDFLAKPIDTKMLDKTLRKFIPSDYKIAVDEEGSTKSVAPIKVPVNPVEEDKVETDEKEETVESSVEETVPETNNLDPETGIVYSGGDESLYLDILGEYYANGKDSYDSITKFYKEEDWKNYVIKVHALKSTSLTIGAKELSAKAKALEFAGKEDRIDEIRRDTDAMLDLFLKVLDEVKAYLIGKGMTPKGAGDGENEADIVSVLEHVDKSALSQMCDEFIDACDSFDSQAAEEVVDKVETLGSPEVKSIFDEALKLCNNFDYDGAADAVKKLKGELG